MPQDLSLLRKIFGHNPNSIPESEWPGMAKAWEEVQAENPAAGLVNRIEPMGWLGKLYSGGADAFTGPFGGIHLNKEAIEKSGSNLGDVLTHETTHVKQGIPGWIQSKFPSITGIPQKLEEEPINMEVARAVKRAEIERAQRNRLRAGGG